MLLSCEDNTKALKEINSSRQDPLGIASNIRMVYSDSLKIQAILKAPKHVDYSNLEFKFAEFPEGLEVLFFDKLGNQNKVVADYGILYNQTKIVDFKGNVVLLAHDGSRLETDQMYWDAEKEWLFTERPFDFENEDYDLAATRLDTNKEFSKFQTGKLTGTIALEEQQDTLTVDEKL